MRTRAEALTDALGAFYDAREARQQRGDGGSNPAAPTGGDLNEHPAVALSGALEDLCTQAQCAKVTLSGSDQNASRAKSSIHLA